MKEWKKLAETKEKCLRLVDGILRKQYKDDINGLKELLVIPKGMRARLVSMAHDYCGHVVRDKVTWTLMQNFTWPGMYKQINTYCQQCDFCQKARRENEQKIPMGEMPLHSKPFENVAVDLAGPLPRTREGYKYILTYICLSSRYSDARPLKTVMVSELAEALLDFFCQCGIPKTVLSDQGTQFMSNVMKATCKQIGAKQIRTTPSSTIKWMCRKTAWLSSTHAHTHKKKTRIRLEWHLQLKYALFALRVTPNRCTGFPPAETAFGHNLCSPLDLLAEELEPFTSSNIKVRELVENLLQRISLVREAMLHIQERTSKKRKEGSCLKKVN